MINGTELLNGLIYTGLVVAAITALVIWWTRR